MNALGNQYALAALRDRRASIAGEIRDCEFRIRNLRKSLAHVDASLKLFAP